MDAPEVDSTDSPDTDLSMDARRDRRLGDTGAGLSVSERADRRLGEAGTESADSDLSERAGLRAGETEAASCTCLPGVADRGSS